MNLMINLKTKYITILSALALLLVASSCEKEIDVDLRSVPPRIQIEGVVKQDSLAKVRVSHTLDFSDNSGYPFLKDAIVVISDNAGNTETLQQDNSGWYVAQNIKGVIGRTYNLSVKYEDKEYTSTSTMPPLVKIDSLSMYRAPIMNYAVPIVHFTDPKGETNQYYRCLIFINGKQLPDLDEQAFSAQFMDGSPIHQFLPIFTNDQDVDPIKQGDDILIEFQCIDKGAYDFFYTLRRVEDSSTNPTSNITGGALGCFYASTVDEMSITAEWQE